MAIGLIDTVLDIIKSPLEKLVPDHNARQKMEFELKTKLLDAGLAQMSVNKAEASHKSIFVAGWRPFVGWVCGCALLWHFIIYDMLNWLRVVLWPLSPAPPSLTGTDTLITILLSMLGLGGLRTVEKLRGVNRDKV